MGTKPATTAGSASDATPSGAQDQHIWDRVGDSWPPQLRTALELYGGQGTYVSLHDWQRKPPSLSFRLRKGLRVIEGRASVERIPEVAVALAPLFDAPATTSDHDWLLATHASPTTDGAVDAFSLTTPWDWDPLVAFYQYFWVNPGQRSRNANRDGIGLLGLVLFHLHQLALRDYVAVVSPMHNPIVRLLATDTFPIIDALPVRIREGK